MTLWTVVRFLHVLSAMLWVGGQLTVSLIVLPLARQRLATDQRGTMLSAVGQRFGLFTVGFFLPVQITTGIALAWHKGVTWASLAEPGYGRILAAKLALFCVVLLATALHGIVVNRGRPALARVLAVTSLVTSVGVVLLATALSAT